MSEKAIVVKELSKQFRIGHSKSSSLRETLQGMFRPGGNSQYFWALKDLDFEIEKGAAVGIIGRNGAGKSTLLKILSRITHPTTGEVHLYGRASALLEVGTGFHPELTGKENIYLNGTILGMSRDEVKSKMDQIIDFSGVEKFLDTPVKHYSSGMKVRLAFSVAAHLEPEILIVDEVLAVGDVEFQKKCLGKMEDVASHGRTVIFVSHNMEAIKRLCTTGIVLQEGKMVKLGPIDQAVEGYLNLIEATYNQNVAPGVYDFSQDESKLYPAGYGIVAARFLSNNQCADRITSGANLKLEVDFKLDLDLKLIVLGLIVKDRDLRPVIGLNNMITGQRIELHGKRSGTLVFEIDELLIYREGTYFIDLFLHDGSRSFDIIYEAIKFEVSQEDIFKTGKLLYSSLNTFYHPKYNFQLID